MNTSQLEQLKTMSPAARTSHYLRKLISKEITREQYDSILKVVLDVPYIPIVSQDGEVVGDTGQAIHVRELEQAGSATMDTGSERCEHTEQPAREERTITSMEFIDSFSLPVATNGAIHQRRSEAVDTGESQKARLLRLLSDGEWHSTPGIQEVVYGGSHLGCSRIAARADDLRHDGYIIESRKISRTIWEYRLGQKDERIAQIADNFMAG
jgi:hypothetical protein